MKNLLLIFFQIYFIALSPKSNERNSVRKTFEELSITGQIVEDLNKGNGMKYEKTNFLVDKTTVSFEENGEKCKVNVIANLEKNL